MIDLIELDLMESFYKLKLKIITTNQVVSEITDIKQSDILKELISAGVVQVDNNGKFENINNLYQACPGLSFTDCSVIELAVRKKGFILSSDGGLRKYAHLNSISVNGVLWIIEELVNKKILTLENALSKLALYLDINDRAPKKDIATLIKKLSKVPVTIN